MIEINLLGGNVAHPSSSTNMTGMGTIRTSMGSYTSVSFDKKDLVLKLLILVIPLGMVYGYEILDEKRGKEELVLKQKEVANLQELLTQFGEQVKEVKRIQEEKTKLESRVATIKELSKERLTNVKALDALHGIIPREAWLMYLGIDGQKVKISGVASEDLVVSKVLQNLEESIYFKSIRLVASEEAKTSTGTRKNFEIICEIGSL